MQSWEESDNIPQGGQYENPYSDHHSYRFNAGPFHRARSYPWRELGCLRESGGPGLRGIWAHLSRVSSLCVSFSPLPCLSYRDRCSAQTTLLRSILQAFQPIPSSPSLALDRPPQWVGHPYSPPRPTHSSPRSRLYAYYGVR